MLSYYKTSNLPDSLEDAANIIQEVGAYTYLKMALIHLAHPSIIFTWDEKSDMWLKISTTDRLSVALYFFETEQQSDL